MSTPSGPSSSPSADAFPVPADERSFEDYRPGAVYEFGSVTVSEEEIIVFASRYDPQSFHVDPVAAVQGPFGGLVASGWHTCALMMRQFAEHYLPTAASLGSPGVDEVRWLKPVRPGDRLHLRLEVLDTRLSRSDPRRGIVRTFAELVDELGEPVLSMTVVSLMRSREGAGEQPASPPASG
ncbi:MaoC domain protein dehydratase [Catenulispora acidiphila DSM 44928]|uniref:MaoC domain protein dehydratase n=1 Tax=Catenulispora acidiphila (strain DSM 44928 / JCM 14897 / NBRC 102108 / NRRL B-24433 / ID139908) TaxID=479433 RepID=C7QJW8_CATAD|nr:MaoC family dehydratase [Catenulispora acidiphila]ACU73206.1 MaoC domain protein dehydratase [Catenulispora acidiphila DSM 44928]